ncbi:CBS domain-containing protein [Pseudonocardia sp. GCM10023141]|uniref:CBS domain-containing protein n=1 Tax=Pseudonocardia sp. GCM10023141 TaxID=3252653 RepID=UPI003623131D
MARVQDIMTARVVTVRSDSPISTAVERMTRYGFSAIPVVTAAHRLVGIVSLLDILRHRELSGADDAAPVSEIMNPDVVTLSPLANASVVAHRLHSHGELRVMPIVEGGVLVGVVTRSDLLRPRPQGGLLSGLRRRFRRGDDAQDEVLLGFARPHANRPPAAPGAPVRDVMTAEVVSVTAGVPVEEAAELLLRHRHTALPVVDGHGMLIGVVSEADLLKHSASIRHEMRTVGGVMTKRPVALDITATVAEARSLVADRGLRLVPVVDGLRLVGVVSRSDLV